MTAITNFISFLEINWTTILVIIALALVCINKLRSFQKLSKEDQKKIALKIIREELLKLMSDTEINWSDFEKSGEIKKAEVIAKIYEKFPILASIEDQDALLDEINTMIEEKKAVMDSIINGETVEE